MTDVPDLSGSAADPGHGGASGPPTEEATPVGVGGHAPADGVETNPSTPSDGSTAAVGSAHEEINKPDRSQSHVTEGRADDLRPREIVRRLDDYIVGQNAAKRSVAIALRNRIRRQRVPENMRDEVLPKNILMIGPTGVGKTEIARRLARLTNSPFLKVEATKFTEVGYVGRDVESIIRDLLDQTITDVHNDRTSDVEDQARQLAEARIVDSLVAEEERALRIDSSAEDPPPPAASSGETAPGVAGRRKGDVSHPSEHSVPETDQTPGDDPEAVAAEEARLARLERLRRRRRLLRRRLEHRVAARQLEDRLVDVEVEEAYQPPMDTFSGSGMEDVGATLGDFFSQLAPPRKRTKRLSVADARHVLTQEETDRLVDMDRVYDDAIRVVEDDGIVFVDEVDKIAGHRSEHGPDISGEGVQRDLLPLLEGSTVTTRYGSVRTDHILFVAAGAFTMSRPSDLIPEFQGRFPIRVELQPLSQSDLQRILCEPDNALTKQYAALLATEDVILEWLPDGIAELARAAAAVNSQDENIGARRLFAMVEKVLEDVSFRAEDFLGQTIRIDAAYVQERLADLVRNEDLRRYVL